MSPLSGVPGGISGQGCQMLYKEYRKRFSNLCQFFGKKKKMALFLAMLIFRY